MHWCYGLDLFERRYWWEAHEVWEGLWLTLGRDSPEAQLVQGMIQLAASHLTAELGRHAASARLHDRAVTRLERATARLDPGAWDIDLDTLLAQAHDSEQAAP